MRRLAWLGLLLFACSNGAAKPQDQPPQAPRDAAVADADPATYTGMTIYKTLCVNCHGADAKGYKADNAPSLVNKTFLESASDDFIRSSIEVGRPGTSMPPYSRDLGGPLDRPAIEKIVLWLRSQEIGRASCRERV